MPHAHAIARAFTLLPDTLPPRFFAARWQRASVSRCRAFTRHADAFSIPDRRSRTPERRRQHSPPFARHDAIRRRRYLFRYALPSHPRHRSSSQDDAYAVMRCAP